MSVLKGAGANADDALQRAAAVLESAVTSGQVKSASIAARIGSTRIDRSFGAAEVDSAFLLGSITKPMAITAVMRLHEENAFQLDDLAQKYLPEMKGEGREQITLRHLMTHVSGLPDQLSDNAALRRQHATLEEFAAAAMRTPLSFAPGSKYQYSSMAILLATEIARRLTGKSILEFVQTTVIDPLKLTHTALGMGRLTNAQTVPMQIEHAAPEAGGGDPTAATWDWNSPYWRGLGAPWGGMQSSAGDVMRFMEAFIEPPNGFLSRETTQLMIRDHNTAVRIPRGLGFAIGPITIAPGLSSQAFGHTGSTGTIAWLDPVRDRALVVMTSLPATAVKPHPRDLASSCLTAP